jgi:outer membrane protein assembly factor BamB
LQNEYRKFRSVSGDIESTLAQLPAEGLAAYRLKADGEARALMNAANSRTRESALAEIVRRFFLSKLGDEAAFELACLKLDRGEFLPAARLLAKVATEYPDPTVRLGEINLRLAAVNARVGDVKLAREMLEEIRSQPIPPVPVAVIRLVAADIEEVATERVASSDSTGAWTMPQGGPTRTGLMPAPGATSEAGLIRGWTQGYELTLPDGPEWAAIGEAQPTAEDKKDADNSALIRLLNDDPFGRQLSAQATAKPATDDEIIDKWKKFGWSPVGQMLMKEGKVYFKTNDRVVCCDAATGELQWFGYRSEYPEDPISAMSARYRAYPRGGAANSRPSGEREKLSFADTLNQSMSIVGDKLLVVQGQAIDFYEDDELDRAGIDEEPQMIRQPFGGGQELSQGRARNNRLFAYHATNGKLLWMLRAGDMLPESKRQMAFAGSPVPYGSLVVVPAYEATSLWLFGLDPDDGKVLWRAFLADEPAGQTAVNSPVRVAIDGGEAYVATGAGIIASVDAISGTLNWAVAYPRTAPNKTDPNSRNLRYYAPQEADLDGWNEDTIIPSGNAIVFAASDFNHLAALDRRSGSLLWESARSPIEGEAASEYVLGIAEGKVCVAGQSIVRVYQLKGGRLLWEYRLETPSYARGMLTKSGIFIPLANSIVRIAIEDGKLLETIPVETGEGAQPLGNLYTDGERIYTAGFREIFSLRLRKEGETLAEPAAATAPPEPIEEPAAVGVVSHLSLATEVQQVLASTYDQLAKVNDAEAAKQAGAAFDKAGDRLAEIAKRMESFGVPDEKNRSVIAESTARSNAKNAEKVSASIARIITVEGPDGDIINKIVNLHKRAEQLPILKAYGIDIEQLKAEDKPEE